MHFDFLPISVGIETLGGVYTPLVLRGTPLPAKRQQTFSTARNNQSAVDIKIYIGERPIAQNNLLLKKFILSGIPSAPKGQPKIVLNIEIGKDLLIKAQAIEAKSERNISVEENASSINLTDDKISQLLKDAEENKSIDKRQKIIGQAEAILSDANKSGMYNVKRIEELLAEIGLSVQNNESDKISSKTKELEGLLKSPDLFSGFGGFGNIFGDLFGNKITKSYETPAGGKTAHSEPEKSKPSNKLVKDEKQKIPNAICAVVGEVIGQYYFNHTRLNTLFFEAGAPGEVPAGNCVDKCTYWLKRCNDDPSVDALQVLGKVLEHYMEVVAVEPANDSQRLRLERILAKYGLKYLQGGVILGEDIAAPTKSLQIILKQRDLPAVQIEFERALADVHNDPEASLTAACAMVESICKIYIEEHNLPKPTRETIKDLWKVVASDLGFDPASIEDEDLRRVVSGLSSIVDGLGSIRTHAGSAHGRGKKRYKVAPRHARLVIHAAHTLTTFLIETWQSKG